VEILETGAMGVVVDEYKDPDKPSVGALSDACDDFNHAAGLEFAEHVVSDESDSESEDDAEGAKVGGATAGDSE